MRNIILIIRREFLTRVQKKSFIIVTFLTPILFALTIYASGKLATVSDTETINIKIADRTETIGAQISNSGTFRFETIVVEPVETLKNKYAGNNIVLLIDGERNQYPVSCSFYSNKSVSIDLQQYVRQTINALIEQQKLKQYNIENLSEILAAVHTNINLRTLKWEKDTEDRETSTPATMIVSYIMGFIIYMAVLLFGMMVMRGVIEEKANRIIEVLISSVRPFQLLMGKIIGIAMVGITQFLLWIVLTVTFYRIMQTTISSSGGGDLVSGVIDVVTPELIIAFLLYFIGGYLLYASMYAAIGSAVESETETQQLSLPVTIPLILAIMIMMHTFRYPDSDLSVWASMIPFTSPIIMTVRIPFGVPLWQILASLTILFSTFIVMAYTASRIYRVGILMYGKKPTLKELIKWFRYK